MTSRKLEIIAEPGKTSFTTRRVVDAPRALVFDAFTKCEHLKRWMGPKSLTMVSCESDLRPAAATGSSSARPTATRSASAASSARSSRPERVVRTFVFEPMPDAAALETLELEERDGKTTITTTTVHKTVENRDGHVGSGMEAGMTEGYARLDELLAGLLQAR